jgi:hypothetical protein
MNGDIGSNRQTSVPRQRVRARVHFAIPTVVAGVAAFTLAASCLAYAEEWNFEGYLRDAPPVDLLVERTFMGRVEFHRVQWRDGRFVWSRNRGTSATGMMGTNAPGRVLCMAGSNYWEVSSSGSGALIHHFDDDIRQSTGQKHSMMIWQLLNVGPFGVPFGQLRILDGSWRYTGDSGPLPAAHVGQVKYDELERIAEMMVTIDGMMNGMKTSRPQSAVHRFLYKYGQHPEVPEWFPSSVTISIRPHAGSEFQDFESWRILGVRCYTDADPELVTDPTHYVEKDTPHSTVVTIAGVEYVQSQDGALVRTSDVYPTETQPPGRLLYYLVFAVVMLAGVVLLVRLPTSARQENK